MNTAHYLLSHLKGPAEIYMIASKSDESANEHVETSEQEFVCRLNGLPHRFTLYETKNFIRSNSGGYSLSTPSPISEQEFDRLRTGKSRLDSQVVINELAEIRALWAEREQLIPTCPLCNKKMEVEYSKLKGSFWGCPMFRSQGCREKRSINPRFNAINKRLSELNAFGY